MILATRIPQLTARMRTATLRAAGEQLHDERQGDEPVGRLIEILERRGYRVTPPQRAA